jgi:hypothetical protein
MGAIILTIFSQKYAIINDIYAIIEDEGKLTTFTN